MPSVKPSPQQHDSELCAHTEQARQASYTEHVCLECAARRTHECNCASA